ncbi:MAG: Gfo/Idh/MocA family oxidoreductase [Clostridiales bacterium]|nr:Gfo/Idh/MocA family oxidoreductase [Clostridiales bacterium]
MKEVRWGIIGTGGIAHRFAQACKNSDGAVLSAVASRSIENANSFADEFGIPQRFGSYKEMAESDAIDAAYVAVPHGLHAACAILFMNNGKHILSEKPITINSSEFFKMTECAKRNKVFLMEAMWARMVPGTLRLMELVKSGRLGRIKGIQGSFCYDMSDEPNHHAFSSDSGGSLLDVGCYALSFASWYSSAAVEKITAVADIGKLNHVDEHCCILIKYTDGTIASLSSAMMLKKPNEGYLFGEKGYVKVGRFYAPEKLEIFIDGCPEEIIETPYKGNGFEEEIQEASRCISAGLTQSPLMPHSQSAYILSQMDEIRSQIGLTFPCDVK